MQYRIKQTLVKQNKIWVSKSASRNDDFLTEQQFRKLFGKLPEDISYVVTLYLDKTGKYILQKNKNNKFTLYYSSGSQNKRLTMGTRFQQIADFMYSCCANESNSINLSIEINKNENH